MEAKWKGLQLTNSHLTKASTSTSLSYPRQPYPADLRTQISLLPTGFADLCMTGELSTRFISMLAHWYNSPIHETTHLKSIVHLPPEAEVFLGSLPSFTTSELLVATAIGAYSLSFAAEGGNTIPQLHLQAQAQQVASDLKGLGQINEDAVLWAQLMIRATTERKTFSWQWANRNLSLVEVTEKRVLAIGIAFFPIPNSWLSDKTNVDGSKSEHAGRPLTYRARTGANAARIGEIGCLN